MGFAQFLGKDSGFQGAAIQFAEIDEQGAVAVLHIAAGALAVAACGQLDELVFQRDEAILRRAPTGRPAAMGIAVPDGKVQRATIRAGLTARDDVPAEARRLGNGVGQWGQRDQGTIGEDLPALVETVVGVLAGLVVNDPVRIAHLFLEPPRQLQAAPMEGQPVPSIHIVVFEVELGPVEGDGPVREFPPQPFRHRERLVPGGPVAQHTANAALVGAIDEPQEGRHAVIRHHGEDGDESNGVRVAHEKINRLAKRTDNTV